MLTRRTVDRSGPPSAPRRAGIPYPQRRADRTARYGAGVRTQVGIVGAGPAGLTLGHLLHRAGIESVILEARSREYVEKRIRAGVLEQGTIDLLDESGVGERMRREGLLHHGIELRFDRQSHRIPLSDLTGGRAVMIYGQTEIVKDLIKARLATDAPLHFEAEAVAVGDLETDAAGDPLPPRGRRARAALRRHRRLRRLPRRLPAGDPGRGADRARARVPVRLAGHPRRRWRRRPRS